MITGVPQTLQPLLADLVLCAGILALVVCAQVVSLRARSADVALLVFAATAVASVASMDAQPGWAVPRMLVVDPFGSFFQFTLSMMAMAEVWLAARSRAEPAGTSRWSATALAASLLGMFTMVSAANVVTAWLGFEMVSMAWALWIGTQRGAALAEAAAALLQAVAASATALLGFALLYGLTGTLEYAGLGSRLPLALAMPGGRAVLYTGLVLVLAGFASRIAVVAWQPWRADLTENAPLAVSAWLETAGTIAVLAMIARFLRATLVASFASGYWIALPGIRWPHVISVAAMVTMTMGNLAAVRADNLRRMIAWLSVAQSGYLMMGLAAASDRGLEAMLTHGVVYALMLMGALACLAPVLEQVGHAGGPDIDVLRGLARRGGSCRMLSAALVVFFLSLAAVPPLAGFAGKARLFTAVFGSNDLLLAAIGGLNSVLGLVCSVRVSAMLFERTGAEDADPGRRRQRPVELDADAMLLIALLLAGTIGIGLWPDALVSFASRSVAFFGG
ncbi:MAG TPA: proton-conducting transporter membrane subunit [Candidatus Limnocylindrales bacterium]|nr:proton-conducting transporter membrane subunit [Candidatus Limnocylindrales bacterium]